MNSLDNYSFSALERFLKYVTIDTQSDPASLTTPSTEKQKNLGELLVKELLALGVEDAELDIHGYVYATIPANTDRQVPVICFCSHMDTSPDCSGENVKPIVHTNYQGGNIVLPGDSSQILTPADHPDLKHQLGNDIITADGTTLLGADNKAGVAEIMDAVQFLMSHPEVKHGKIRILFTPDEEIGRGVDKVDIEKLGARFAYTVDGETCGSVENETFSADSAILVIKGVSSHPGFARGHMQSALKIAAQIVANLPKDRLSPESTGGKEGFVHPVSIQGNVEEATIGFILRDFDDDLLRSHGEILREIAADVIETFPGTSFTLDIKQQYRNMKQVLKNHPELINVAEEAIRRSGATPKLQSIRGGTDGSRLSFMGLPCPNIFAGEHAFHGKHEWVSVQDMQKAVKTIVHIAALWEERS